MTSRPKTSIKDLELALAAVHTDGCAPCPACLEQDLRAARSAELLTWAQRLEDRAALLCEVAGDALRLVAAQMRKEAQCP